MLGKIFCIIGKSATGKDHFYNSLLKMPELALEKVVLYTTRPVRKGEEDGITYHFVDMPFLEKLRKEGRIIEERTYETIHGPWIYFTADEGQIDLDCHHYLLIGTLESFVKLRDYFGRDRVCPVYIEVEDGERLARALKRERKQENPKFEEMCRRFLADQMDFSEEKLKQAEIGRRFVNVEFENCLPEIVDYIKEEMGFPLKGGERCG